MSNFKEWNRDRLRERFGLKRIKKSLILEQWLDTEIALSSSEKDFLLFLQKNLKDYADFWNEEELKIKFIGNLISLANFDTETLSAFAERELSGEVDGEYLIGKPDIMIARGKQEVKSPFFFLHEYKKELDNNSPDPAGQCLAAMLLAYEKNKDVPELSQKPIYGVYVIGRNWFFMILKDREYAISDAYVATQTEQLFDILRILKVQRERIREIWGE